MKKRMICICLCLAIALSMFGCNAEQREVTCEEVAAAYKEAGYGVFHNHDPELGNKVCYVDVNDDDGEQIFFYFYETAEEAEAEHREYHVLIWLFSVIYGDPTWVYTKTYRNIEIEYTDKALYKPFAELIK